MSESEATKRMRERATEMRLRGMTGAQIAERLGVTKQRISQLIPLWKVGRDLQSKRISDTAAANHRRIKREFAKLNVQTVAEGAKLMGLSEEWLRACGCRCKPRKHKRTKIIQMYKAGIKLSVIADVVGSTTNAVGVALCGARARGEIVRTRYRMDGNGRRLPNN